MRAHPGSDPDWEKHDPCEVPVCLHAWPFRRRRGSGPSGVAGAAGTRTGEKSAAHAGSLGAGMDMTAVMVRWQTICHDRASHRKGRT